MRAALVALTLTAGIAAPLAVAGPAAALDPPSAPTNVKVVAGAQTGTAIGRMTVTWDSANAGWTYQVSSAVGNAAFGDPVETGFGTGKKAVGSCPLSASFCRFKVQAVNAAGAGAESAIATGTWTAPPDLANAPFPPATGIPTIQYAFPGAAPHTAVLVWKAPADTGGRPLTKYEYEVTPDVGPTAPVAPLGVSPTAATVPCGGITVCLYRIRAVNSIGPGPWSNYMATAFNPPGAPTGASVQVLSQNLGDGSSNVLVTWAPPGNTGGSPLTGYQVGTCNAYCATDNPVWIYAPISTQGTTTNFLTSCPAPAGTCSYRIRALNNVGAGPWSGATWVRPSAPSPLTARPKGTAGAINLGWSMPPQTGAGIDHYKLSWCLSSQVSCSTSANWVTLDNNVPAIKQAYLAPCGVDVQCSFRLTAIEKITGRAGQISQLAVATGGATTAKMPGNVAAVPGTALRSVKVTWTAPTNPGSSPVTGYLVKRSTTRGSTWGLSWTIGNVLSFTDTNCGVNAHCTYKVAPITAAGTGVWSYRAATSGANTPGTPTGLTAAPGSTVGAVNLAWAAPVDDGGQPINGYKLERSLDNGYSWPTTINVPATLSYTDATCGGSVVCTYRVSAKTVVGTGSPSAKATATAPGAPSAPRTLTATTSSTTLGAVNLSWLAPLTNGGYPVTSYEFRYDSGSGFTAWSPTGTGTGTSFAHPCGVATTCTYEVRALNSKGSGPSSNQATAGGFTDTTAPTVTVTVPADGTATNDTTPALSGTAGTTLGDAATVTVDIRTGVFPTLTIVQSLTVPVVAGNWSVNVPLALADDTYTVRAYQTDWAANTGASSLPAPSITIDTATPAVTIGSPAEAEEVVTSTPAISGTAGAAANDGDVDIYVDGNLAATVTPVAGSWSWNATPALADGAHTVQAYQADTALNVGDSGLVSFTVNTA